MAIKLSFLSVGPTVWHEGPVIRARTSLYFAAITLGLLLKDLTVDPGSRTLVFSRRLLWVFSKTWRFSFDLVKEVRIGYENWTPFAGWRAEDATDVYCISLDLHDGTELRLFHWYGPGEFQNSSFYPDWWFWSEYLLDVVGTQEDEAKTFFTILRRVIAPATPYAARPGAPTGPYGTTAYVGPGTPVQQPRPKPPVRPAPPPGSA